MRTHAILAICVASVVLTSIGTAEDGSESYVDAHNPVRIYDWDMLNLLFAKKAETVTIKTSTQEELLKELRKIVGGIDGAENVRFRFEFGKLKQSLQEGSRDEVPMPVDLKLRNIELINLLDYVSRQIRFTFSITKDGVVFRPLLG